MQRRSPCTCLQAAALAAIAAWAAGCASGRGAKAPSAAPTARAAPKRTVAQVVAARGPAADARLAGPFQRAGVTYPPRKAYLLVFKRERKLELWASDGGRPAFVRSYAVLAASGRSGPKLREGDLQVPEGLYWIVWLHPNSSYHFSIKLDYPNEFDRRQARVDGRTGLGGDIFIHGSNLSIGCIAVGDRAIKELFVLAARAGIDHVPVIIAPSDLRRGPPPVLSRGAPLWTGQLYARIDTALRPFQLR